MFNLEINVVGNLEKAIQAIGATESQVRTAAVRAINKTALWVQSKSAREISSAKKIQLKLIRQKLRVIKANRSSLKSFVMANLYGIKASKLGNVKQDASGASVASFRFEGAFVAKMPKSGHTGIFKRKTAKRLTIQEQYIQINPEASEIIRRNVDFEASEIFMKYFKHEIEYATS